MQWRVTLAVAVMCVGCICHRVGAEARSRVMLPRDYGVKLCGREFIRAVIFTCGGSRWKRSTDGDLGKSTSEFPSCLFSLFDNLHTQYSNNIWVFLQILWIGAPSVRRRQKTTRRRGSSCQRAALLSPRSPRTPSQTSWASLGAQATESSRLWGGTRLRRRRGGTSSAWPVRRRGTFLWAWQGCAATRAAPRMILDGYVKAQKNKKGRGTDRREDAEPKGEGFGCCLDSRHVIRSFTPEW